MGFASVIGDRWDLREQVRVWGEHCCERGLLAHVQVHPLAVQWSQD